MTVMTMNERIRELAEQADIDCELLTRWLRPNAYIWTATDDELAKFAELIVNECVDIADDYVKDFLVEEHIKFNHPRSKIGLKIKEHFGVGEK